MHGGRGAASPASALQMPMVPYPPRPLVKTRTKPPDSADSPLGAIIAPGEGEGGWGGRKLRRREAARRAGRYQQLPADNGPGRDSESPGRDGVPSAHAPPCSARPPAAHRVLPSHRGQPYRVDAVPPREDGAHTTKPAATAASAAPPRAPTSGLGLAAPHGLPVTGCPPRRARILGARGRGGDPGERGPGETHGRGVSRD